jgi:hypothetical protein
MGWGRDGNVAAINGTDCVAKVRPKLWILMDLWEDELPSWELNEVCIEWGAGNRV